MPEIKWIKISTSIFDDEKIQLIEAMPDADTMLVIWLKLLVLAGKVNDAGDIHMTTNVPYTDEMLATLFRRPLNTIRLALQIFQKFKMVEITDDLLCIVNWDKYQNIETMDKIRQLTKERVRNFRDRQKPLLLPVTLGNVTVTQTERERERERDKEEDNSSSSSLQINLMVEGCFLTYEKEIGLVTPIIKDEIIKYSKNFPPEWINDALVLASKNNHRSWGYAAGILKNWAAKGRNVTGGDFRKAEKTDKFSIDKFAGHYLTGQEVLENIKQRKEDENEN